MSQHFCSVCVSSKNQRHKHQEEVKGEVVPDIGHQYDVPKEMAEKQNLIDDHSSLIH